MSEKTNTGAAYPGFVSSTAAADRFMAPDSIASRPDPESSTDRPRTANQVPSTALEADLPKE